VTVSKSHIERGIPRSTNSCPIAMALKDRGIVAVAVAAYVECGDTYFRHTESSRDFVYRFDRGEKVCPTTFRFTEAR
jgi:hypothetical protein